MECSKTDEKALDEFWGALTPLFNSRQGRKLIRRIDEEEMNALIERAENILLDALLTGEDHGN